MANSRIKGITVEIDGNVTGLDKALQGVNKNLRSTQSKLNDVNKLLKFDPQNTELLSQKQEALQDAISQTSEKLKVLKETSEQAQQKLANGDIGQDQYDALQREIIATEQSLQRFESQSEEVKNALQNSGTEEAAEDVQELGNATEDAKEKSDDYSDSVLNLDGKITDLAKNAIDSAKEKLKEFSQQFLDTENTFAKLQAATGETGESFEELKDTVQNVYADNFGESMDDAANAVQTVNQNIKGLDSSQLQSATESAMTLEDVFGMDMTESVRGVSSLMNHFGITSEQAFNLISSGAQNGLNFSDELGDNLAEYSGKFAEAGYSAQEYFQLLQNGADGGFYNLDKVNDAINEVTTRLGDGTIKESIFTIDDETGKITGTTGTWSDATAEVFKKWQDGSATQKDVIEQLVKDINSVSSDEEKMNLASTAFGSIAEDSGTKAITSLTSVGDTYLDTKDKADELNSIAYDTPQAQLESLKRTIETDVITPIGESLMPLIQQTIDFVTNNAPNIQNAVQGITDWISNTLIPKAQEVFDWIQENMPVIQATIGGFLAFIAGYMIGAKLAALIGIIMQVIEAIKNGTTVMAALNMVMGLNPIGLVVAAIAALVAAFVILWNKCDGFREFWIDLWKKIQDIFSAWCEGIKTLWEGLKTTATNIWTGLKNGIVSIVNAIKDTVSSIWNRIKDAIVSVVTGIKDTVSSIWNGIKDTTSTVFNAIKDFVQTVWDGIKSFIVTPISDAFSKVKEVVGNIYDTVSSIFGSVRDKVSEIWDSILGGISGTIGKVYDTVYNGFESAWDYIRGIPSQALGWGQDIIQGIVNGIKSMIGHVQEAASNIGQAIKDFIGFSVPEKGPLSDFETYMPDMMNELASGINKNKSKVTRAMAGLASGMSSNLTSSAQSILAKGSSIGSSVVYNTYNNQKTLNQTNNSPKALNRLEIYRQTQLAVNRF